MMKLSRKHYSTLAVAVATSLFMSACSKAPEEAVSQANTTEKASQTVLPDSTLLVNESRLSIYHPVELTSDLSHLSDNQQKMIGLLIDASKIMDDLFWKQAFFGDKNAFLNSIENDDVKHFASINYGPWDRLNGDNAFLSGYEEKALGAEFYPHNMTKAGFATATFDDKQGLYSLVKQDEAGNLYSVPYSEAYKSELTAASNILKEAAELAEDPSFKAYLLSLIHISEPTRR